MKDKRNGELVVHDEDFNVRNYYSIKEIQNCNAWVHHSHATIRPILHGCVLGLVINVLGTWTLQHS